MFSKTSLLALAAVAAVEAAAPQGFNYGSMMDGKPRAYADFKSDFSAAQNLNGAPGTFNAARLYTMIDGLDNSQPISALQAAMDTKTYLLLGLWASGDGFKNELTQLNNAIKKYPDLAQYVLGISVGSEDLYRISPTGLSAPNAAVGQEPSVLVDYIKQVRSAIATSSSWSGIKVGHVDTWNAWVNGSNSDVIANSDFLGVDTYPYYQNTEANGIQNGASLFNEAVDKTKGVAGGKPVWITETGWPVSGPTYGDATVGADNAKTYWQDVGCPNFGNTPTFWYTLYDGVPDTAANNATGGTPSFSVVDRTSMKPLYDLSCSNVKSSVTNSTSSSSATSSGFATSTASGAASTGTGSSGSGAANGTYTGSPSSPSSTGTSSSGSGSGSGSSGSGSASGSAASPSASVNTSGASSLKFSLTSMAAVAAAVVAFL